MATNITKNGKVSPPSLIFPPDETANFEFFPPPDPFRLAHHQSAVLVGIVQGFFFPVRITMEANTRLPTLKATVLGFGKLSIVPAVFNTLEKDLPLLITIRQTIQNGN